jgi:hypothetical protein
MNFRTITYIGAAVVLPFKKLDNMGETHKPFLSFYNANRII